MAVGATRVFAAEPGRIRIESLPVGDGAELITWFEVLPDSVAESAGKPELPLLSVLNDSFSDRANHLRQVWLMTAAPPTVLQRLAGTIPFFYYRPRIDASAGTKPPHPAFDLGEPARGVWSRAALAVGQAEFLNPAGAIARLTARSYGGNLNEYETTHAWEALDLISPVAGPEDPEAPGHSDFEILESRLELRGRMFSGLASDQAMLRFNERYLTERAENRGHNWELLRQTAENNGLYFQPLAAGGMKDSFAMVWASRDDIAAGPRRFDAKFLKISNPFGDNRLIDWKGYTEARWEGEKRMTMIPLALYALDYPGLPLLLVDFRRPAAPGRTEMMLHFTDDMTTGVFGLTGFGVWKLGFDALKSGWLFVDKRHGAATNRAERQRAFVQLRHALGTDDTLDPDLRNQIVKRLGKLDLDPMGRSWDQEVRDAWRQYDALLNYAADPKGLPKLLEDDRKKEAHATARHKEAPASTETVKVARNKEAPPAGRVQSAGGSE
jgi:hypothetical protein